MSVEATAQDMRPQFRLRPGQDDRLIEWLHSFSSRQRSQAIREALRAYLHGRTSTQQGEVDSPGGEDPDLAAALDALF